MMRSLCRYRLYSMVLACAVAVPLGVTAPRTVNAAAPLVVTTTTDAAPPCTATAFSLRCAIAQANADGSGDTIAFHIPLTMPGCGPVSIRGAAVTVCTIAPAHPLPTLTAGNTTIDGYSQTGAVSNTAPFTAGDNAIITIRLDGTHAGAGADGLDLAGSHNTVSGLSITGFVTTYSPTQGQIGGNGVATTGSNETVQGNLIGVMPDGITVGANQFAGVNVLGPGGGETVGGTLAAAANVLSGNGLCAGGDCSGFGVYVSGGTGTAVVHNYIGTSAGGRGTLPNDATGMVVLTNDNRIAGNVISANGGDGFLLAGSGNLVVGNKIGTDATGTKGLGNHSHGIEVQGPNNILGGTAAGAGNTISANGDTGLVLEAAGNVVQGNRIGTDMTGAGALGNGFAPSATFLGQPINGTDGLTVCSGPNTIGGVTRGAGNVISGNAGNGLSLVSDGNLVQGNVIGANAQGTAALPNGVDGIGFGGQFTAGTGFCQQAPQIGGNNNTIGGTARGAGNLISGNKAVGIEIVQGSGNVVQGNGIGVNAALTAPLPNGGHGVSLGGFCDNGVCHGSSHNMIGGTSAGAGNVVSGNGGDGIHIDGLGNGISNVVQGNGIGTDTTGTAALGNVGSGVVVGNGAVNDSIGGAASGAGNVIAHNGGAGVLVGTGASDTGTHSAVQRNAIFANGGLGIDLAPQGTVTCASAPPGPNDNTPCPTVTRATTAVVRGTACAGCTVEVYRASNEADDQGHGEGHVLLGSTTATTGGAWSLTLAAGQVTAGQRVTASATTPVSFQAPAETSEFAANAVVAP